MWKSYYAHERLALFGELATLLRHQYGLPVLRSHVVDCAPRGASHPREDLDRDLAVLQGELYHLPPDPLVKHARLRADAMLLRDLGAEFIQRYGEQ
jgi:hypothetical protein